MGALMATWHYLKTKGGVTVPVQAFAPVGEAKAALLMLPALGVQARFYQRLAKGLSAEGVAVYLFEQRGHGQSPYRPKRGEVFGCADYMNIDIPTAMEFVRSQQPNVPFYLGGHSLGGHMASIVAGRQGADIAGVFHLACGFPYAKLFNGKQAKQGMQIRFLAWAVPLLTFLLGFFPGDKLGFGGREYSRLMMDWRKWALGGNYNFGGYPELEDQISRYSGGMLSIGFEHDYFVSEGALDYSRSRFQNADVTRVTLGETEQGSFLGHFDWAKAPDGAVSAILGWLKSM